MDFLGGPSRLFPILTTLPKVAVWPALLLVKYNRNIAFTDNLMSIFMWMIVGWAMAHPKEQDRVDVFRSFQRLQRKSEKDFPSWLKRHHSLAYDVVSVNSADGTPLALHVVKPLCGADTAPVLVVFHGGGCCMGSPLDKTFKDLVERYGRSCTLIAPDYRLALEGARWPAGLEDCMAAVRYGASRKPIGSKLLLTGASAGGYLTMACALRAKEERIIIDHLLPIAPNQHIDADDERRLTPRGSKFGGDSWLDTCNTLPIAVMRLFWRDLLTTEEDRGLAAHDLRTADYARLPPTTVFLLNSDCTADEAEDIHERILAAGGQSRLVPLGATHSYGIGLFFSFEESRVAFDAVMAEAGAL